MFASNQTLQILPFSKGQSVLLLNKNEPQVIFIERFDNLLHWVTLVNPVHFKIMREIQKFMIFKIHFI